MLMRRVMLSGFDLAGNGASALVEPAMQAHDDLKFVQDRVFVINGQTLQPLAKFALVIAADYMRALLQLSGLEASFKFA